MPSLERREVSIGHRTFAVSGGSRSGGPPKPVPLLNESAKSVPTPRQWGQFGAFGRAPQDGQLLSQGEVF